MLARGFLFAFRELVGDIHKQNYYQDKGCRYLSQSINLPEIHFSNFLSSQTVINKNIIPKERFRDNTKKSYRLLGNLKLVPIKGIANQAADKLLDKAENVLNQGRYFFLFIKTILPPSRKVDLTYE